MTVSASRIASPALPAFAAGVEYARGVERERTVAEIVEWLRAKSQFSSRVSEAFVYPEVAKAIEARFSPAAPSDKEEHEPSPERPGRPR
jgi:anti-sigma-K factor RskA